MEQARASGTDMNDWYRVALYRLIAICRATTSKYSRSKVRKALPKDFSYIIDELCILTMLTAIRKGIMRGL